MAKATLGILTLYNREGSSFDSEEMDFFSKLTAYGEQLGLSVFVFAPEDADGQNRRIAAKVYDETKKSWIPKTVPFPDLIFDRCRSQRSPRFIQLKRFRSMYPDVRYLNRPLASKWGNYRILAGSPAIRPHLPETVHYRTPSDLSRFLRKYPIVYLKPRDGTGGCGIAAIRRTREGRFLLQGRDPKRRIIAPVRVRLADIPPKLSPWGLRTKYLVQQGIPTEMKNGRVHDFRLLIQKNGEGRWEVTGVAGRVGGKGSVTSNLHGGGKAYGFERLLSLRGMTANQTAAVRSTMHELASDTAAALEGRFGMLCELALDLAVDPEGRVWLLEVNPKPSREVFRRIGEEDTYTTALRRPLEFALWLHANPP